MHKDTVPVTGLCTLTGLYEWRVMPQGSSTSRERFVKVINEVMNGLKQVEAYLDDVMVFDPYPTADVNTMRTFFELLRKHNLNVLARRPASGPQMLSVWATLFRPPVFVRTRTNFPP